MRDSKRDSVTKRRPRTEQHKRGPLVGLVEIRRPKAAGARRSKIKSKSMSKNGGGGGVGGILPVNP